MAFALRTPPEPPTRGVGPLVSVTLAERRMARRAAETLAAVGQLSPEALTTSVARVHTKSHRQIDTEGLLEVLEHTGLAQLQNNGLLISAADIAPRQAHLRMLAAARSSGRTRRLSITGAVWHGVDPPAPPECWRLRPTGA